jgi:hypothetical protein
MSGTKRLITQDRYNVVKQVLNAIPKGQKGLGLIYNSLGIGSSSASYIRKSENYQGYKEIVKRETSRPKAIVQEAVNEAVQQPAENISHDYKQKVILEKLDSILAHLVDQDRQFNEFKELYSWVAENAVVGSKRKLW